MGIWNYYKKHGPRALVVRVVERLRDGLLQQGDRLLGGEGERIHFFLEEPVETSFGTSSVIPVAGWACAQAGIASVEISIDGEVVSTILPDLARPDVAAVHASIPDAGTSGFSEALDVSGLLIGDHELVVTIEDRSGKRATVKRTVRHVKDELLYHRRYLATLPADEEAEKQRAALEMSGWGPCIHLWLQAGEPDLLVTTLESMCGQSYVGWTCNIVAPRREWNAVRETMNRCLGGPEEEKFTLSEELDVEGRSVSADYLGVIGAGETFVPHALLRWVKGLADGLPDLSYADSDRIKDGGLHCEPNFKPDWSPDHALSRDYVGGVYLVRNSPEARRAIAGSPIWSDAETWRYDLWLRLTEISGAVHHVAEVLWSRRWKAGTAPATAAGELRAVRGALERRGVIATVDSEAGSARRRVRWPVPEPPPLVSIIIPTTGRLDLVTTCLESLRTKTKYRNYELIFLDNSRGENAEGVEFLRSRDVRMIECPGAFNWATLGNIGAVAARGDHLLFLNDDVEIVDGEWLEELVAQSARRDVGTVGALLLYPDGRIQHAGIFLVDHGGGARHLLQFLEPEREVYQDLHRVVREVSASTGACLMVRRDLFEEIGGFDEELAIVGNDVDLCLRAGEAGYRNIWTPYARVVHHESISRKHLAIGPDESKVWKRWKGALLAGDPFYNPNLSQTRTDCSIKKVLRETTSASGVAGPVENPDLDLGVNLIGYIRAEMGVGEAARSIASALEAAAIPFDVVDYQRRNPSRMADDSWLHRVVDEPVHEINILHVNADLTPDAVANLPESLLADRYSIGYWVWELPDFPDDWLDSFNHVNEVWVPSSFVQDAVSRKSPVPVVRIPHSIKKGGTQYLGRTFFGLPERRFLFLVGYDRHSVRERKNPEGAIRAFQSAFPGQDRDVGLVIKLNNPSDEELNWLRETSGGHQGVHILDNALGRLEVDSLIDSCDCLVSLHRSEGFGLMIAEAMALGKPVIATGWSGNTDFMRWSNAACVDYELAQLKEDYGPYKAGLYWAEPDIDDAARWMRRLAAEPGLARKIGDRARRDVEAELSPAAVGRLIRERLRYIGRTTHRLGPQ